MTAPRIDAVRAEIARTIRLLHELDDNLLDLHVLAYERGRTASGDKVNGGSRDYALDNHGSARARDLYDQVARRLRFTTGALTDDLKELRGFLTSGPNGTRRDRTADCGADEIQEAIDAQTRRRVRGEYEPTRLVAQPRVWSQTEWRNECEALRSAVRKAVAGFVEDHQWCQSATIDQRGQRPKLRRRVQTKLLTPREREAWSRANQSVSDNDEAQAV